MVAFEDRNAELPKLTIDISSAELIRGELDCRMGLLRESIFQLHFQTNSCRISTIS